MSRAIANRRARKWTWPLVAFSWSGATFVWFGVAGALLWARGRGVELIPRQTLFLTSMLASLASLVFGSVIKRLVRRPRPFADDSDAEPIARAVWAPGRAHSFPSTHSSTSTALATALLVGGHPFGPYVAAWALITAWSRIYLGVHYPSDVLGGAAIGVVFGIGCSAVPWATVLPG